MCWNILHVDIFHVIGCGGGVFLLVIGYGGIIFHLVECGSVSFMGYCGGGILPVMRVWWSYSTCYRVW